MEYFGGFFAKLGYFAGFLLYIICCKDQRSCDGQGTLYFLGAELLIQDEAFLSRVQRNSEGWSVAQKDAV